MNIRISLNILLMIFLFSNAEASEYNLERDRFEVRNKKSDIYNIKKSLEKIGDDTDDIELINIGNSGIYGLKKQGYNSFFITSDGKYIIKGDVLKIENGEIKQREQRYQNEIFFLLEKKDGIFYQSDSEKDMIYVFIDYTCPFCYKFHKETLEELLKQGISVTYLPILKNHLNKKVRENIVNIFCLKNKQLAKENLNKAFEESLEYNFFEERCEYSDNIERLIFLTNILEIEGTPAVYNKNGYYLGGYNSAQEIMRKL